jgi:hypothetical protein
MQTRKQLLSCIRTNKIMRLAVPTEYIITARRYKVAVLGALECQH